MNRNGSLLFGVSIASLLNAVQAQSQSHAPIRTKTPNIVFILADDLGYGDVGCLGQQKIPTPNIDRLAAQGKLFTQHYAGSPVSAPSRSCLVTGQHTGHTPIRGNKEYSGEGQQPLPEDTYTVFRLFKEHGYTTGVFGKWGLGAPQTVGAPNAQGVDEFFGYNCQRLAHSYYPYHLWHNTEKVMLEENSGMSEGAYAPYLIHEAALQFIEQNRRNPFFLWYTTTIPHAELRLPASEIDKFVGRPELATEKPFHGCDSGPAYKNGGYGSQEHPHAAYAAMVALLDRQVGELCDRIDSLGLADNTLIVFSSDNGPHREGGADPEFFNSNGRLRGFKRDLYEGGIRVPFIVRWPGVVEAGSRTGHVSAFWDFLPTVAELLDAAVPVPIDGISYLPTLTGKGVQREHDYLYWEFHEIGGRQAVRQGDWKAIRYNVSKDGGIRLYHLADDIRETRDRAAEYPRKVEMFDSLMRVARTESEIFRFGRPGPGAGSADAEKKESISE